MNKGVRTIIYPTKDLAKAKVLFRNFLGVEPYTDQPYYVGFKVGDQDIGLVPNSSAQAQPGMIAFYYVDKIQQSLQCLLEAGAKVQQDIKDVGGGRRIASVVDPDGNIIGLMQDT